MTALVIEIQEGFSCPVIGAGAAVVPPYQFRLSGEAPAHSTVNVASSATSMPPSFSC